MIAKGYAELIGGGELSLAELTKLIRRQTPKSGLGPLRHVCKIDDPSKAGAVKSEKPKPGKMRSKL